MEESNELIEYQSDRGSESKAENCWRRRERDRDWTPPNLPHSVKKFRNQANCNGKSKQILR